MIDQKIVQFYARRDIQKAIAELAKDRELAVRYGQGGFGKRPDVLQYPSDIAELARQGVTSFHISEERWKDPLELKPGMAKRQLDDLRLGWDLVLDIDTNFLEFAKAAAILVGEALRFNDVSSFGVKFSGRSGFHIFVPFESFPAEVNNQETRLLFPDGVRNIANYLKVLMKDHLREQILSMSTVEEIRKGVGKQEKELLEKGKLNPFTVVDIDSVLISSRHMFRSVYSINEKSGLVSVPVLPNNIKQFSLQQAKIENVSTEIPFIVMPKEPEAKRLIIEAFDKAAKTPVSTYIPPEKEVKVRKHDTFTIPKVKIKDDFFPPCIKKTLEGMESDGRKRAVFVLINFFRHMGYTHDEILERLLEWNKKNYEELKEGYIRSQVSWQKRQKEDVLPPNCDNQAYYPIIGTCQEGPCKFKNAVNYVKTRLRMEAEKKKPKKKRSVKKKITKQKA